MNSRLEISRSPEETIAIAVKLGQKLRAGDVVALVGQLGAGKTVFARGLCRGLDSENMVSSPSFTLVNIYQGRLRINHVDLYRLSDIGEVDDLDSTELFYPEGVTIIEWAERAVVRLPEKYYLIRLKIVDECTREIETYDSVWPDDIC